MIHFFSEEIEFSPKQPERLRKWLGNVVENEGRSVGNINYIYCSDLFLLKINQSFLGHDSYTDIITFDQSTDPVALSADIYISIEQVRSNANQYHQVFDEELRRVMVHGVLHLIGYNDKTIEEQHEMRKKEEAYLSL